MASLARPGGNITGIFVHPLELAAKRVELLRESLPQARHLGLIWDASSRDQVEAAAVAAKSLNFEPRRIEVTDEPPDYAAAFEQMADMPGEPIVIPAGRYSSAIAQRLDGYYSNDGFLRSAFSARASKRER